MFCAGDTDTDTDADADGDSDADTDPEECSWGDVDIHDAQDLADLVPYDCITGFLDIRSTDVSRVELPNLAWIGEDMRIDRNPQLTAIDMSRLESIGADTYVLDNDRLQTLNLGALRTVEGASGDDDGLEIADNPSLTSLDLGSLETILRGRLVLDRNDRLATLELPMLSSIDSGYLNVGGAALRSVDFPSLTTLSVRPYIDSSPLTSLRGFSRLEEAGGIFIWACPDLPCCDICTFAAGLSTILTWTSTSAAWTPAGIRAKVSSTARDGALPGGATTSPLE